MIEDEAALLADIRFALRGLDPWPPKGNDKHPRRRGIELAALATAPDTENAAVQISPIKTGYRTTYAQAVPMVVGDLDPPHALHGCLPTRCGGLETICGRSQLTRAGTNSSY